MKKKVLLVLSTIGISGGVQNVVMDIYRKMDKNKVQFDFFVLSKKDNSFEKEILNLGGKIYYPGNYKAEGLLHFLKIFNEIIISNNYDVVHIHAAYASLPFLMITTVRKVNCRIVHSHGSKASSFKQKIYLKITRPLMNLLSTKKLPVQMKLESSCLEKTIIK